MKVYYRRRWMQRRALALLLGIILSSGIVLESKAGENPVVIAAAQAERPGASTVMPGGPEAAPRATPLHAPVSPLAGPAAQNPAAAVPKPEPVARSANVDGDRQRTRFSAELSQAVKANVFTLADPYRVVIELPQIAFQIAQGQTPQTVGLVKDYRFGLFAAGKSRIVLDVTGPVLVEHVEVAPANGALPAKLTVDLVPTERGTFLAGLSRQLVSSATGDGLLKTAPLAANARATKQKKQVIVIDPGHGGHDGGANKNGTVEKDVVLAFGLMLREKLRATGRYEVLMTRETDTFIELDERRDFAQKNGAALFMAIHADYVPGGTNVRGATIYTLRDSVAKSLARARDKGATGGGGDDVIEVEQLKNVDESPSLLKKILADLAGRENKPTQDRTNFFAKNLIEYMGQTTELKAEPHREAAFRVLKSAQVPSVLIELAYVSNRQDAANLKSDAWRDNVSASLVSAVNRYFSMANLPL